MKTAIIVQARMTSTRLPGKVLKEVLGKPLLAYLVERLRRVKLANAIVIATTTNDADLPIVELCRHLNVPVTRGSEHDVLARYYEAASIHKVDVVVRVTSDCPLHDPAVIDQGIRFYHDHVDQYDYISNALTLSYPYGMATEVFPFSALEEAHRQAESGPEREHVTPFIYTHPDRYRVGHLVHDTNLSQHRWTVDTPEDFELVRRLIEELYPRNPDFGMQNVLEVLKEHPDWPLINAHVVQKKLGE